MYISFITESNFICVLAAGAEPLRQQFQEGIHTIDKTFFEKILKAKTNKVFTKDHLQALKSSFMKQEGEKCLIKYEFLAEYNEPIAQKYMRTVALVNLGLSLSYAEVIATNPLIST